MPAKKGAARAKPWRERAAADMRRQEKRVAKAFHSKSIK